MMLDELRNAQQVDEWDATTVDLGEEMDDLAADLQQLMQEEERDTAVATEVGEDAGGVAPDQEEARPAGETEAGTLAQEEAGAGNADAAAGCGHPTGGLLLWLRMRTREGESLLLARRISIRQFLGGLTFVSKPPGQEALLERLHDDPSEVAGRARRRRGRQ